MKIKKIIPLTLALSMLLMFVACSKNTTAKRFDKIVTKDGQSWRLSKILIGGTNAADKYQNFSFSFTEGKAVLVSTESNASAYSATWNRGEYNKPLYFDMSFPVSDTIFNPLSDNFTVTYLMSGEFRLKRVDSPQDEIVFKKR